MLKRFGSVYGESPTPGNLTIFCPACPQPGINLPPDWRDHPPSLIRRTITVDGNMKADRIKTRRPDLDVWLMNGAGYMVNDVEYQDYLKIAKEPKLVSFRLILWDFFSLIRAEVILSESQSSLWCWLK